VDLRQNKRYRLKVSVTFSWEQPDGSKARGEGYTRDISSSGVFVLTSDRLPSGTAVRLEVALPSLREKTSGTSLQTQGHVVRSEEIGFAAAADVGFRMRFPQGASTERVLSKGRGNGRFDVNSEDARVEDPTTGRRNTASRFWM
jgi:hypothetical protein